MHHATEQILKHFEYHHLPRKLQVTSQEFYRLAHRMAEMLPEDPETTVCLRKLLEAKDCAVRAARSSS